MEIISLFSGAGGLDYGFHKAGFRTVVANEYDPKICPTFRENFPNTTLIEGDIRKIPSTININIDGIDYLQHAITCNYFKSIIEEE